MTQDSKFTPVSTRREELYRFLDNFAAFSTTLVGNVAQTWNVNRCVNKSVKQAQLKMLSYLPGSWTSSNRSYTIIEASLISRCLATACIKAHGGCCCTNKGRIILAWILRNPDNRIAFLSAISFACFFLRISSSKFIGEEKNLSRKKHHHVSAEVILRLSLEWDLKSTEKKVPSLLSPIAGPSLTSW